MRVLVTGGAGYVGSVSVAALLAAGHSVFVLDDLSRGHRAALSPDAVLFQASYGDPDAVAKALAVSAPDAILHCAALSLVGESMANPELYHRVNVAGGRTLIDAALAAGVRRLVLSSSAAVYGNPTSTPIAEDAPLAPVNPYGETKRQLEGLLSDAVAQGMRSVSLRYFNVAGATTTHGEDHDPETHLIPNVLQAIEGKGAITLFGTDYPTPDGTCVRDYIHVADLAAAHLAALEATAVGDARTGDANAPAGAKALALNLGLADGFSVRQVLAAAKTVTGLEVPVIIGDRRAGDPAILVADATRAHAVLGWEPSFRTIEGIIASAWEWRRRHPASYGD